MTDGIYKRFPIGATVRLTVKTSGHDRNDPDFPIQLERIGWASPYCLESAEVVDAPADTLTRASQEG